VALKARGFTSIWRLRKQINEGSLAQAAVPSEEIRKLLSIVGNVDRILIAQAILIVLVSALGTGLAMFNSMSDRRRDIAVMRALGARRRTIFSIIVGEAVLISIVGAIFGFLLGHLLIDMSAPAVQAAIGFSIPPWSFQWFEPFILLGVLFVGTVAGIGPAVSAYRTDVATGLTPNS
jgi:putative ABC transport system permease protein